MACTAPVTLTDAEGFRHEVRCGQCRACRLRRKLSWVGRLRLEAQCHKASRFVTLTYKQELRPKVLNPDHLRDFLKRYRYHYGRCRFFAVGEYGEKNEGAHWHLIIFGHPPIQQAMFRKRSVPWRDNLAWDFGFSSDGNVDVGSIAYIAGYTMKNSALPTVTRMSLKPGLGFTRIDNLAQRAVDPSSRLLDWPTGYTVGGKRYPLCDGGLARFKVAYLEAGGMPPIHSHSPMVADLKTRMRQQGGLWLRELEASYIEHRRMEDAHALPAQR